MKPIKYILACLTCAALLFGAPLLVLAAPDATCNVPSTKYPTIAAALDKTKCTNINIAAGTYHEHNLYVGRDMTITGAGPGTIIDGDGEPILYVGFPTTNFTLSDVTLQNAASNGGALALDTDVTATVSRVTFRKNTIGLWMQGGTLTLTDSTFKANNGLLETTAAISRDGNGGDMTITNTKFKKNRSACASAIYSATDGGTALLMITDSQFIKNSSNGAGCKGGAIYTSDPTSINGAKFTRNTNSMASSAGGAIYQTGSGMSVAGTTFSGNSAAQGGGIYSYAATNLTLTYNVFDNNVATVGDGGGLLTASPTVLINSTFSNNQAQGAGRGGGIAMFASTTYAGFLTFSNNTANSGGNVSLDFSTLYLKSSILNQGGPENCVLNSGVITSKGSNLSSDASCTTSLNQPGDKNNKDPKLNVLANNGGPTKTHALLTGSPAINKSKNCLDAGGSVVIADQRGVHRPQGNKCDIGAYELELP